MHSKAAKGRYDDARTVEYRELEDKLDSIAEDFGGRGEMTGAQLALLDSIRTKLIVLKQVSRFVAAKKSLVDDEGNLLPVLNKNFVTYTESIRRDLQALYDLAKKRPPKAPNLDDYISRTYPDAAGRDQEENL
jgi:hypothetical protein